MKYVVTCGHPGSLESLVVMLRAVGHEVYLPDRDLTGQFKQAGMDTLTDPEWVAKNWGYDLTFRLPRVGPTAFESWTRLGGLVYADTKAHRNGPRAVKRWSGLAGRVLWYRINGGEPADVPGKGPELDPGCPVLTPDLWYRSWDGPPANPLPAATLARSYVCWPPFAQRDRFTRTDRVARVYGPPVCLVHNLEGWGYGEVAARLRHRESVGLRCYGGHGSPDGHKPHRDLPGLLSSTLAYVHLKSVDAPGYSLYEAVYAGCPIVIPRRFVLRCQAQELFQEGKTCLTFDVPTEDAVPVVEPDRERYCPIDTDECVREVEAAVAQLTDPETNLAVGLAAKATLERLTWSPDRAADVESFSAFLSREFP